MKFRDHQTGILFHETNNLRNKLLKINNENTIKKCPIYSKSHNTSWRHYKEAWYQLGPIILIIKKTLYNGSPPNFTSYIKLINQINYLLFTLRYEQIKNTHYSDKYFSPLSANPTRWPNTLKQFFGINDNCLSVFDHFVKLALKGLRWQQQQQRQNTITTIKIPGKSHNV